MGAVLYAGGAAPQPHPKMKNGKFEIAQILESQIRNPKYQNGPRPISALEFSDLRFKDLCIFEFSIFHFMVRVQSSGVHRLLPLSKDRGGRRVPDEHRESAASNQSIAIRGAVLPFCR